MSVVICTMNETVQQLEFLFPDGSSGTAWFVRIAQSSVLQDAMDTAKLAGNSTFDLAINVQLLQAWIRAADVPAHYGSDPIDVAQCIQVCN